MNKRRLPHALFAALVAAAVPAWAGTAQSSSSTQATAPTVVYVVDDATLGGITGKFYGADMLVGVRIDIISRWQGADGAQMSASGALWIERDANGGYIVRVDSRSDAAAGDGKAPASGNPIASGAEGVQIAGIGQVTQIAGNDNRLSNIAAIRLVPVANASGEFNGQTSSFSGNGGYVAQIEFADGGVALGLTGPNSMLMQQLRGGGNGGQALQVARVAGDGQAGSNSMQLQLLSAAMPAQWQQQLGIYQALSGMQQLPR